VTSRKRIFLKILFRVLTNTKNEKFFVFVTNEVHCARF